ncbi:hypothetical protein [Aureimonas psammosilenae]|uniref:hypothetical protein n=1 Tax=Aureimonas psammosilenae TaxID=2495496 RepID=UPI001869D7BE|nr:hypothetical protein [Aureimonas psammosilenae]
MTRTLAATLAFGLLVAASAPAFADCAGHVSADAKPQAPVTTADSGNPPPPPVDRQG